MIVDLLAALWPVVCAFGFYIVREVATRHLLRQSTEADSQRRHELDLKATSDRDRLSKLEAEVKSLVLTQNLKGLGR